jgi:NAD(P)H dehydrogenase (quinone)
MITVTGATGHLGRLVIQSLLEKIPAKEVTAAVRDPDKAKDLADLGVQVRLADYTRPATLKPAFTGTEKLLLISASDIGQRARQHQAVIEAALESGVDLMAYTSMLHADRSPLALSAEHKQTEAALRRSGLPSVILRNGWYTENYTAGIPAALEHGTLLGCAGEGRISSAARADYAAAAAKVLLSDGQDGLVYELAGDGSFTMNDLAAEISAQTGKDVVYKDMPEAQYREVLISAGLPEVLAKLLADSDRGASQGGLYDDSGQLSRLIGRPTTTLKESIAAFLVS